jgi:Phosphotransferase enzyme family
VAGFLDLVVTRESLAKPDGKSGSLVEKATLSDGRTVVIKRMEAAADWLMRATEDEGRVQRLWKSGLLERMPASIEHTMLDVQPDGDGWLIVMKDVSSAMLPEAGKVTRSQSRGILQAAAAMHQEFAGTRLDGFCTLEHRYSFLSPTTAENERDGADEVPRLIGKGWEIFAEITPDDVASAVMAVLEKPATLAERMDVEEPTLIHGDLKFGNVGFLPKAVAMIDWGDRTGFASPAVEFGWYLAINGTRIDAGHEQVLEDFVDSYSLPPDMSTLRLALFGALVQLGWNKALGATQNDPAARAMEERDLAWWIARARDALEEWSPN